MKRYEGDRTGIDFRFHPAQSHLRKPHLQTSCRLLTDMSGQQHKWLAETSAGHFLRSKFPAYKRAEKQKKHIRRKIHAPVLDGGRCAVPAPQKTLFRQKNGSPHRGPSALPPSALRRRCSGTAGCTEPQGKRPDSGAVRSGRPPNSKECRQRIRRRCKRGAAASAENAQYHRFPGKSLWGPRGFAAEPARPFSPAESGADRGRRLPPAAKAAALP